MKPRVHGLGARQKFGYALIVLVGLWLAGAALPAVAGVQYYVPNEFIIHVRPGTSASTVQQVVAAIGGTVVRSLGLANYYLIRLGAPAAAKSSIRAAPATAKRAISIIDRVQPNIVYRACVEPTTEPYWAEQWDMVSINCPQGWDIEKGDGRVRVAVVDTGVAYDHPDLADRCISGYDAVDWDYDAYDMHGHGTHVAGTIGAQGNNGIGICGVCWDGVKIMPIRVLDEEGSGTTACIVDGLNYALTHGVHVVNMSLGGPPRLNDGAYRAMIAQLASNGVIVVAAAGNDAWDVGVPALYPEVICVASTGPNDEIAPYSSFGPGYVVDIAAPGGDSTQNSPGDDDAMVFSTVVEWVDLGSGFIVPILGYAAYEGTSMACPHVAGAAALLLSQGVAASDVRARLLDTARPPGPGPFDRRKYGAGILDVGAALANASVCVVQPEKGSTVGTDPAFKIKMRGIQHSTVRVLFDYADADGNGIPDNPAEPPIIDSSNLALYADLTDQNNFNISFTWSELMGGTPLTAGRHYIYAEADPQSGGMPVYDWATFEVVGLSVDAGLYMFAFPYALDTALVTPSDILTNADFSLTNPVRSVLRRYLTTISGYATYYPSNPSDVAWVNPLIGGVPTGGCYYDLVNAIGMRRANQFGYPVGAGFWLILPEQTPVSEAYTPLEDLQTWDGYFFDATRGCRIPLYAGWNMIGNPYVHPVPLGTALVVYRGQTKTLLDAAAAGWISLAVLGYETEGTPGYESIGPGDMLQPYRGYWVRAFVGTGVPSDSLFLTILP